MIVPATILNVAPAAVPRLCPVCASSHATDYRRLRRRYAGQMYTLDLVQCSNCCFVFVTQPPAIPYDSVYLDEEGIRHQEGPVASLHAHQRIRDITRYVPPSNARFLDIGIGDGLVLKAAESVGYITYGLDISSAMVELARARYSLRGDIRVGHPADVFPCETFDVIHMNEVIEHLPEPLVMLGWCQERLRPQGRLVVQTGNIDSMVSRLKGQTWDYFRPVHVSYFSRKTLEIALTTAGFTIVKCITTDWKPKAVLTTVWRLWQSDGAKAASRLAVLYMTSIPRGIRRNIVAHAVPLQIDRHQSRSEK